MFLTLFMRLYVLTTNSLIASQLPPRAVLGGRGGGGDIYACIQSSSKFILHLPKREDKHSQYIPNA